MPPMSRSTRSATVSRQGRRSAGRSTKAPSAAATASHHPAKTTLRRATGSGAARSRRIPPTTQARPRNAARRIPATSAVTTRRTLADATIAAIRAARDSRPSVVCPLMTPPSALT